MCGGTYLCFEGAEKIFHYFAAHGAEEEKEEQSDTKDPDAEDKLVKSAVTTDLILSAEIMVISLNEVIDQSFWMRLGALLIVAIVITLAVYGAVGVLIKMDDLGIKLLERNEGKSAVGNALVKGMPVVLDIISVIGTAAMLWVGGHIVIKGLHEFGINQPHGFIHHLTEPISNGALSWTVDTVCSMAFGFVLGAIVLGIVTGFKKALGK